MLKAPLRHTQRVRRVTEPHPRLHLIGMAGAASLLLSACGCLNPEFVNSSTNQFSPVAPGDQPFLMVRVINDTSASVDFSIVADEGSGIPTTYVFNDLDPGSRNMGVVMVWPILRVALGDLDNPFTPTIFATFASGLTVQVPFGHPALVAGVDYKSGDTVIFRMTDDSRSPTFIRVDPGLIDGSTQTGPFARADTFATVRGVLVGAALIGP